MPYQFTVSPDFGPAQLAGWHILNTFLQKSIGEDIHLEIYNDFESQRDAIKDDQVDLIYANPYDASMLVREKGFLPVVMPKSKSDEAIIAVNIENAAKRVEDLQPGVTVASTDDPDVNMMGMIMLEPADLDTTNVNRKRCESYILVAKQLLRGESDVGFFLAEAFNGLSHIVKDELRPLVSSQIQLVKHALMVGPRLVDRQDDLRQVLMSMEDDAKGAGVLESLGLEGWEAMDQEEMEFMLDLMSTLVE